VCVCIHYIYICIYIYIYIYICLYITYVCRYVHACIHTSIVDVLGDININIIYKRQVFKAVCMGLALS